MENILSIDILKKYYKFVLATVIISASLGLGSAYLIKPSYKVTSIISISPSYFQNSLMREFLSEVYDPSEIRSQRQSIISEALDREFLDTISKSLNLIPQSETEEEGALRRLLLIKSIEIVPLQSSDFQISVSGRDRAQAIEINKKIIQNILNVLREKRLKNLTTLRAAIATQLDTLASSKGLIDVNSATSPEALRMRIDSLIREIELQSKSFSNNHPVLISQRKKLDLLQEQLSTLEKNQSASSLNYDMSGSDSSLTKSSKDNVFEDLTRKYRYVNIVLMTESTPTPSYFSVVRSPEYPLSPIWPKKSLFLIWSTMLGLFISISVVLLKEVVFKNLMQKSQKINYNLKNAAFEENSKENEVLTEGTSHNHKNLKDDF